MKRSKITLRKITVLGAGTIFGKAAALLLKLLPVRSLRLYDYKKIEDSNDLKLINPRCRLRSYVGETNIGEAIEGADVIVIGDEQSTGNNEKAAFIQKAPIITEYVSSIAKYNPGAIIVVATTPVNLTLPLVSSILKQQGKLDPCRVMGLTNVDVIRASSVLASHLRISPGRLLVPVVGGGSPETRVPLFSKAKPSFKLNMREIQKLTSEVKTSETLVYGARRRSEVLNRAYATAKFLHAILASQEGGNQKLVMTALCQTDLVEGVDFFSLPLILGKKGIEKIIPMPRKLTEYERGLLSHAVRALKVDRDKVVKYLNDSSKQQKSGKNDSQGKLNQIPLRTNTNIREGQAKSKFITDPLINAVSDAKPLSDWYINKENPLNSAKLNKAPRENVDSKINYDGKSNENRTINKEKYKDIFSFESSTNKMSNDDIQKPAIYIEELKRSPQVCNEKSNNSKTTELKKNDYEGDSNPLVCKEIIKNSCQADNGRNIDENVATDTSNHNVNGNLNAQRGEPSVNYASQSHKIMIKQEAENKKNEENKTTKYKENMETKNKLKFKDNFERNVTLLSNINPDFVEHAETEDLNGKVSSTQDNLDELKDIKSTNKIISNETNSTTLKQDLSDKQTINTTNDSPSYRNKPNSETLNTRNNNMLGQSNEFMSSKNKEIKKRKVLPTGRIPPPESDVRESSSIIHSVTPSGITSPHKDTKVFHTRLDESKEEVNKSIISPKIQINSEFSTLLDEVNLITSQLSDNEILGKGPYTTGILMYSVLGSRNRNTAVKDNKETKRSHTSEERKHDSSKDHPLNTSADASTNKRLYFKNVGNQIKMNNYHQIKPTIYKDTTEASKKHYDNIPKFYLGSNDITNSSCSSEVIVGPALWGFPPKNIFKKDLLQKFRKQIVDCFPLVRTTRLMSSAPLKKKDDATESNKIVEHPKPTLEDIHKFFKEKIIHKEIEKETIRLEGPTANILKKIKTRKTTTNEKFKLSNENENIAKKLLKKQKHLMSTKGNTSFNETVHHFQNINPQQYIDYKWRTLKKISPIKPQTTLAGLKQMPESNREGVKKASMEENKLSGQKKYSPPLDGSANIKPPIQKLHQHDTLCSNSSITENYPSAVSSQNSTAMGTAKKDFQYISDDGKNNQNVARSKQLINSNTDQSGTDFQNKSLEKSDKSNEKECAMKPTESKGSQEILLLPPPTEIGN